MMNPFFTTSYSEHNMSVSAQNDSGKLSAIDASIRDKRFGYMMRQERMAMGLTQTELGKLLGISTSYVSSIERGKRGASGAILKKMHDTFKFSYDYMMGSAVGAYPAKASALREEPAPYGDIKLNSLFATCSKQDLDVCYRLCRTYLLSKEK